MALAVAEDVGIQFEEDYMYRNSRSVTSTPDIALTEFVANAWDAGAYNVFITIPDKDADEEIVIEDDGVGMTDEEFKSRWMTLNYNRQKRQGKDVVFPDDVESYHRIVYGRNGIGRHGMLCFNSSYKIETWRDGVANVYDIAISHGSEPFKIVHHKEMKKDGHGTKISTFVHKNFIDAESMTDIISARFLYDPKFVVKINDKKIDLLNQRNIHDRKELEVAGKQIILTIIDSTKTAIKSQQHGIAFWVGGRLVGKPSWQIGDIQFLDGRCKPAKRYTIIVQTDDLIDDIVPDWTQFQDTANVKGFLSEFKPHIDAFIKDVMVDQIVDLQSSVIKETRDKLETLTLYGKRDISKFIEIVTTNNPVVSPDFLKTAVEAMVSVEKAKKGGQLLMQLSNMTPDSIDKLSEILESWDVDDIVAVIAEIDKRITVIEAISRIYEDKNTDELHTLHPLVLNARWLFGAEFDSPMFTSNRALDTVVKTLFKESDYDLTAIENGRKRPDIVCLNQSSFKAVCTERSDDADPEIMRPDQILIVELKRGGFSIGQEEFMQALNYVRQIKKSAVLHSNATIKAYVVGATVGDVEPVGDFVSGKVEVITYGHLIQTAKSKLLRLHEHLSSHYDALDDKTIVEKALAEVKQLKMNF